MLQVSSAIHTVVNVCLIENCKKKTIHVYVWLSKVTKLTSYVEQSLLTI
jgi:hypothetical protein